MKSLLVLALLFATSCTTLTVTKVEAGDQDPGIRYSLPKPILRVFPKSDGTLDVAVEYVPDEQHTYAIDASSCWASHKLEVEVQGGLLKKVIFNSDSTVVGEQVAGTSGEIAKALVEQENKRDEDRRTREKEDAEEREEKRKVLEDAIDVAQEAVDTLKVEIKALKKIKAPKADIDKKRVDLKVANKKLAIAKKRLETFEAETVEMLRSAIAEQAHSVSLMRTKGDWPGPHAWGPVFYEIVDELGKKDGKLELRAIEMSLDGRPAGVQLELASSKPPKSKPVPPHTTLSVPGGARPVLPSATRVHLAAEGLKAALQWKKALSDNGTTSGQEWDKAIKRVAEAEEEVNKSRDRGFSATSSRSILQIDPGQTELYTLTLLPNGSIKEDPVKPNPLSIKLLDNDRVVEVTDAQKNLPDGNYKLKVTFSRQEKGKAVVESASVPFRIEEPL